MSDKINVLIVDDDPDFAEVVSGLLESRGYVTTTAPDGHSALDRLQSNLPDVLVADIMMPGMDGFELCKRIRDDSDMAGLKIIFVSAKSYEFDRKRALALGADGFIAKPIDPDTFGEVVGKIVEDRVDIKFWGVRGTLPVPGEHALRYGGNTPCVTLEFTKGGMFVLDAGTGIKSLSDSLVAAGRTKLDAKIFISHPHWDHINALPFFVPLYTQGSDFEILGASHGDVSVRELIGAQMEDVYFPITVKDFSAHLEFRDLREETLDINGVKVSTMLLSHPGNCLGYRFDYKGRSVCYITDNELFLVEDPAYNPRYVEKLVHFCQAADVLITDSTYTDEEYLSKIGWGHSCISQVVDFAHRAEVKTLNLFHHDPDQSDDDIDAKLALAQEMLQLLGSKTACVAPKEGDAIAI